MEFLESIKKKIVISKKQKAKSKLCICITFEVPASELASVMGLVLLIGETFKVIIEDE